MGYWNVATGHVLSATEAVMDSDAEPINAASVASCNEMRVNLKLHAFDLSVSQIHK